MESSFSQLRGCLYTKGLQPIPCRKENMPFQAQALGTRFPSLRDGTLQSDAHVEKMFDSTRACWGISCSSSDLTPLL